MNITTLETAGWLHNIGKSSCDEKYAEKSLEIAESRFVVDKKLKNCILNHGFSKKPKTF